MIKKLEEFFEAKKVKIENLKTLDSICEKTESLKFKDSILHIFHDLDLPSNFSIEEGYASISEGGDYIKNGPFNLKGENQALGSDYGENIWDLYWGQKEGNGIDGFDQYLLKNNQKLYYCISIICDGGSDEDDENDENDFGEGRFDLESMQFEIEQLDAEISRYQFDKSVIVGLMRSFKMCPDLVILGCSQRGESEVGEGFDIIFC